MRNTLPLFKIPQSHLAVFVHQSGRAGTAGNTKQSQGQCWFDEKMEEKEHDAEFESAAEVGEAKPAEPVADEDNEDEAEEPTKAASGGGGDVGGGGGGSSSAGGVVKIPWTPEEEKQLTERYMSI